MAKRRFSADSITSLIIDWNLCLFCQKTTKESLVCPGSIERKHHDPKSTYDKIATNIEKFELLGESPISIQFDDVDKDTLSEYFIKNNGKFHKSCNNKFSDLKLERAEKRSRKDHQPEILAESDVNNCLLYTSPSPRDATLSRMPSSA